MSTYRFSIEGPLLGYRAGLDKVWDKDKKLSYDLFKEYIRLKANLARVPSEIAAGQEIAVHTLIHWKRKARIDGSNILKAFEDALFGQDRGLAGGRWKRRQHTGLEEYVEVVVTIGE